MSAKVQGDSADIFSSAAVNQMTTSAHTFFGDASREAAKDPSDPLHHLIYPDAFATTMTVPLQSLDERLGSLVLHKDAAFKLVDEDEEVLRVFADQAAIAIKSARLLRKGEQREARLEASQGQYRSFVKQLSDGIFRLDKSGNVMELSDCAADLFGVAAEELISLPLKRSFAASDHPQLEKSINLALEGNGQELILKVQRPDNRQMIVIVRIGPLLAGGNVVGLIGVARDDTARIAMQSKLLVREKLASVGMLAAGVAHEINNPLSFIISNLVTLTEDRELETGDFDHQEQLEMLRECLEGTDRIKNIVSNLKQFSQLGSHEEFFTVDLNPIIESTTWMVYPEARYHGRINLELTPIPSIHCSPGRIAQLFVQLMLNGIEALPQGDPEDQFINVKTKHEGDCIILEIADSGKGISRQALPLIIEPYYTTKGPEHGTGLGLVMCREVVQRHRGQMCIQTKEGEGTTVRIALPINPLKTDGLTPTVVLKYADEILAD
jgi:PAS domain S-box-containing protein